MRKFDCSKWPNRVNCFNFFPFQLFALLSLQVTLTVTHSSWDQWWAYDGISGPSYWGILNPKWSHCTKGRKQSPIDINPDSLLFDPGLESIQIIKGDIIHGDLINTGRGLKLGVDVNSSITITSGPLSYQYSINHMIFHYGTQDDRGSEHRINGVSFPGELQLYFYNSQLYHNWTQAAQESNGLAVIAVLIHIASSSEEETTATSFNSIVKSIEHIKYKGTSHKLESMSIHKLLPTLDHYITYEGSLTEPPCHETVQWIVLNKPLYATYQQLSLIRNSLNIDGYGDNYRPIQLTNYRCVRTNILREFNTTIDEMSQSIKDNHHEFNKKRICGNKGYVTYKANIKRDLDGD